MERHYVLSALGYGLLGLVLGLYMSASGQHQQLVTHAHIMLVGFLLACSSPCISWARRCFLSACFCSMAAGCRNPYSAPCWAWPRH